MTYLQPSPIKVKMVAVGKRVNLFGKISFI